MPYINASIILQLLATSFPSLKKLQREEGPQGRARFQLYQKLAALVFAIAQSVGQLTYIRPYVTDFGFDWLLVNSVSLTAGAMILVHVSSPSVLAPSPLQISPCSSNIPLSPGCHVYADCHAVLMSAFSMLLSWLLH